MLVYIYTYVPLLSESAIVGFPNLTVTKFDKNDGYTTSR